MLSPNSAPVIRATLPIVGAALPEITARFYDTMFADHPELLDGLFNRANQANGTQRTALAGAIAAFAGMLVEHPDQRPDAMLARIAHKHASLGITADQYRIVHTYLFGAIAEVLGEAVTAEVAAAWDEVYWLMANALIALEARLYAESGVAGHDTRRPWRVVERRTETDDVVSFTLKPEDAAPVPAFRPGQYVTVSVRLDDDTTQLRQYSVSGAPGGDLRRISVKRVHGDGSPEGEVSNWLHANLAAGDLLTVSAPFGDVTLDEGSAPLVLASAGIGCTPMIAMLEHLVATGSTRPVTVVHADRSPPTTPCGPSWRSSSPCFPTRPCTSGTNSLRPAGRPPAPAGST